MLFVCRLYIKQAQSSTSFSGDDEEPEWAEYRIKETNVFTADKYQQVCSSNTFKDVEFVCRMCICKVS